MKRLLPCVISAMLVMAVTPFASGAAEGSKAKTNGTGKSTGYGQVHVNADDNGDGEDFGHFFIGEEGSPKVQGDATCLRVEGDKALVGGFDRQSGTPFLIEITDNGEPGRGEDQHRWRMATPMEVSGECNNEFGPLPPPETIQQGNYIVRPGG